MAAPATPPTTPPTTTGVGVLEELEPLPLPDAAVLEGVLLVVPPIPPPPIPVAAVEDEELGEYKDEVELVEEVDSSEELDDVR